MTQADRAAFAEAMLVLGETFNEPVGDIRVEAYFDALADLNLQAVTMAVRRAVAASKFFPRPVELREFAEGSAADGADLAWGAVLAEIRRVGYVGTPALDARTLDTVRQVWGGWTRLCETLPAEGPELVGWVKQFKSVYQSVSRRDDQVRLTSRAQLHPSVQALLPKVGGAR